MRHRAVLLSALLVVSLVGAAAAPAAAQSTDTEGEAYAGHHVQFNTTGSAVSNYAVGDAVIVENVSVQSSEEARSQAGIGLDVGLSAATSIAGSAVESRTEADASVRLGFESGAAMQAHDNARGIFQVQANDSAQMVQANLSNDAEAESESDERVVVTKEDGSQGAFIVVGDGEVVVNEAGNVTAEVEEGSQLVYRQYDGERSDDDERKERMIQNGTATAEVYLQESAETGEDAGAATASVVEYGQDTAVDVESQSREEVNMTVERSQSQGKVVLTSVSESAFDNTADIEVFVDGEAAAQADSYSEVEQSAMEGDEPRYYVSQSSSAEATATVAIGIDHFSERAVSMQSTQEDTATATATDASTESSGEDDTATEETSGDGAGFGALAALAALGSALLAARRL